jgi:hypothetical protein
MWAAEDEPLLCGHGARLRKMRRFCVAMVLDSDRMVRWVMAAPKTEVDDGGFSFSDSRNKAL